MVANTTKGWKEKWDFLFAMQQLVFGLYLTTAHHSLIVDPT
jgi:hypothetical protein